MPDLPSGTVTFLFTDVEGSTRLLHELGAEAYAEALSEHRRLIRAACAAEEGVEVDTQGDAFFFAFPTAPGALAAASAFTNALASGPIQVRVGLHTGTPLLTEEGYVGDDVHFAARVASSGHGGQVILSSATAELVELELTDLGEHRLKDIEEAVSIHQLGDDFFPPLKTISNTNLPRPASSFLGRQGELQEVLSRIEQGTRLVTFTGPGGTGKTRLALEAASSLVPSYKAGVFWVGLASLRDPALVTETIGQTLGAKDSLTAHVGERELLLLLDNLEQVVDCAPELSSLLESCPNLTLLVTSRELLRISGEVEYPVPPLAEPEAISLFCERAQTEPTEEIAELCGHLDSLPLAVELAAARTKALTTAQILERLSSRLDLLKGGRDADPRQQTLRATIEWSYDLLSPDEQQLFAWLSVFSGGCTLEAAEDVCSAEIDTLQSLVEKSLLRFTNERYWMLETIREHAAEQLDESEDATGIRDVHAAWFLALSEEAGADKYTDRQIQWLTRLEQEHDNLRAALAHFQAAQAPENEITLVCEIGWFWLRHGHWREAYDQATHALSRADGASVERRAFLLVIAGSMASTFGDLDMARRALESSVDLLRTASLPTELSRSLSSLGHILLQQGAYDQAEASLEEALELARAEGSDPVAMLLNLSIVYLMQEDADRAAAASEEVLAISEPAGDIGATMYALENLGHSELVRGHVGAARAHYARAIRLARETGDVEGLFSALEGVAASIDDNRPTVAAEILGASERVRERSGGELQIFELALHDETVSRLREHLDESELAVAWEAGRGRSFEEAVQYALASID